LQGTQNPQHKANLAKELQLPTHSRQFLIQADKTPNPKKRRKRKPPDGGFAFLLIHRQRQYGDNNFVTPTLHIFASAMKRLAAFIFLLIHMNYFMFLPQGDEADTYGANGQQTDDINSVVEYVRVVLGYDKTADDEDDDSGNNITLVKTCDYFYQQQVTFLKHPEFKEISKRDFAELKDETPKTISYDIISPPPKA